MKCSRIRLGAMKERLARLAEEAKPIKEDPNAGRPHFEDENQQRIWDELYDSVSDGGRRYRYDNQKEIGFTKIPEYAPQHSKQIALNLPWRGEESLIDMSNRMLHDSKPVSKIVKSSTLETKRTRKTSISDRLSRAREGTLDYKLNKDSKDEKLEEDPMFSQLYRDRFLSAGGTPFSTIESIASQRIEDAIARNEFKDIPRGTKSQKDLRASSPFIDTTQYFLNKMIQRQGAAPPWIEKQAKVNDMAENMRRMILEGWKSRAIKIFLERHENAASDAHEKLRMAKETVQELKHSMEAAKWLEENKEYHTELIRDINSSIRGYNLQAPGSARKGYLELERELEAMFDKAAENILTAYENHLIPKEPEMPPEIPKDDLWKSSLISEKRENHYGLRELFRDLWTSTSRN